MESNKGDGWIFRSNRKRHITSHGLGARGGPLIALPDGRCART